MTSFTEPVVARRGATVDDALASPTTSNAQAV
jgi:hypothetical protein